MKTHRQMLRELLACPHVTNDERYELSHITSRGWDIPDMELVDNLHAHYIEVPPIEMQIWRSTRWASPSCNWFWELQHNRYEAFDTELELMIYIKESAERYIKEEREISELIEAAELEGFSMDLIWGKYE